MEVTAFFPCSVQLVVQPVSESVLEQLNKFSPSPSHRPHPHTRTTSHTHVLDDVDMGEEGREVPQEPSPFSTKKEMYSGKARAQVHIHVLYMF